MKKLFLSLLSLVFITNFNLNSTSPIYDISGNNDLVPKKDIFLEKVFEQNNSLIEQNKLLIEQMIKQSPQKDVAKPALTPQGKKSVLSKFFGGTTDTFKYFVDKSDKIVSKKGLIAVLLLSALPVYLYHNHISDKTLPKIFYSTSNKIGQGMAVAGGSATKGIVNGAVVEVVKNNKMAVAKGVGMGIGIGAILKLITEASDKLGIACLSLFPFALKLGSKFYLFKFAHPNLPVTIGTQTNF